MSGKSFILVRISRKKNARILLGRRVSVQLPCAGVSENILSLDGELVSVRSLYSMENEFSAHLRFSRVLQEDELKGILEADIPHHN